MNVCIPFLLKLDVKQATVFAWKLYVTLCISNMHNKWGLSGILG